MSKEIKKVLVIKLGALGDFVLALAAMKKIREAHPRAKITLLTTPPFEALARLSPYFNAVEVDGRPSDAGDLFKMLGRIRKAKYDRVYDLQTNSRTGWYFQALRPFPPQWSGIAKGASLPQRGRARYHMHTLERHADQLRQAGIWPDAPIEPGSAPPPDLSWILRKHKDARPVAGAVAPKPYVLLVPGGSAHRPEKRWPVESYAQLAALLKSKGLDIVIIGGPQESAMARQIQKAAGQARDLTGRTDFAQLAVLGAKAALVVGNDTGPTHLLAAAGAPTIALFSDASDPALCGPRGHVAVIRSPDLKALPVSTVASTAISLLPR
ncbi:ADP-heptose--LPS heptosyltransferase [Caulobacter sp. D4A]|uniref:glycosyltransferase family 9 protein n=1 Tax=unclassified Caulobacter TaxID=2648921 RepID=UPI000D72B30A|nr:MULTISPECIES: glycosyltransferase family 9 protein [unclassified Caulobacter]PXA88420.1 ADP-heptose--LPS heptosyltransferase [Caulobacter sp. D4A]PXA93968.1 ADP-heptose--LPS heptosyltransferase [Caulobacter sp. D5]